MLLSDVSAEPGPEDPFKINRAIKLVPKQVTEKVNN